MDESHISNSSQASVIDVSKLKDTIVSIEYPGRVINDQEAFRTMGGLPTMSAIHAKENRKYLNTESLKYVFRNEFEFYFLLELN